MDNKKEISLVEDVDPDGGSIPRLDEAEFKKVLRRIDLRLIPLLSILYLLSFLDRGNGDFPYPNRACATSRANMLTGVCSRKRQCRWPEQGLGSHWNAIQYRLDHVLHSIRPLRSSEQYPS